MSTATTDASATIKKAPPAGYTVHREASAEVLLAEGRDVFINPIQEFNRDLSTLAIRTWSEIFDDEKRQAWERKQQNNNAKKNKKRKFQEDNNEEQTEKYALLDPVVEPQAAPLTPEAIYKPYNFTLFEGLSATGLRSIRYAKEIPLLRWVLANDLLPQAAANIKQNVDWNDLGATTDPIASTSQAVLSEESSTADVKETIPPAQHAKVRVSQGDCCSVLYSHREAKSRFDVIDLDPYGTAVPFIDGSVQAINDGGLLCVTCTDLAVLAGGNYPEKCFTNYGGSPVKAEYTHEGALRLLLHTLATSAARYGRYIEPLLSLSIDYYIRVFVRVRTGPAEVKKLPSQTSLVYVCHQCQAFHMQAMGKATQREDTAKGTSQPKYGFAAGPPCSQRCEHCNGSLLVAGPLWSGPLHQPDFIAKVLSNLPKTKLGTADRIAGMVTMAQKEIRAPFYFTPARISSAFHATSPPLVKVAWALVNAGYDVSRSHACAGSIKTNAPSRFIFDIIRKWMETNPVTMSNIKEGSPARVLLAQPATFDVDFTPNSAADKATLGNVKIVRYPQNPTANWGPQAKAGKSSKGKTNEIPKDNKDVEMAKERTEEAL